jgi:hypothetical protein
MFFNSFEYAFFLPIVAVVFWLIVFLQSKISDRMLKWGGGGKLRSLVLPLMDLVAARR